MDDWDADTADTWETADTGFDVADDWDVEVEEEKPASAPAPDTTKKETKVAKKLTLKEKLKLKEAEEAAAAAAAAAARASKAASVKVMSKEEERRAIEESEISLAADLFDGCKKPSDAAPVVSETNARAAALAASTGLFDGYDGLVEANTPEDKTGPDAAPSVLDAINLDDKEVIPQFAAELSRKIKDYGNSANALSLMKEILNGVCPHMKLDHIQELLRVVTVQKNAAAEKEKGKKKNNKKPHLAKDRAEDIYNDYF